MRDDPRTMRSTTFLIALGAAATVTSAAAAADGELDASGTRLLAEGRGARVCLTLVEPKEDLRLRRCLREAADDRFRTRYVARPCAFGTRLFGVAPPGTNKVNLSNLVVDGRDVVVKVKLLRIPTRVQRAGGRAFVVRRSLEGTSGVTLTAYDRDGERLATRRLGTYPTASCQARRTPVSTG